METCLEGIQEGAMTGKLPIGPFDAAFRLPLLVECDVDSGRVTDATVNRLAAPTDIGLAWEGLSSRDGAVLASYVCARSAMHHACAFCEAVEDAQGTEVSEGHAAMRVVLCEWERIASHLEVVSDVARALEDDLVYGRPRRYVSRIRTAFEGLCFNAFGQGVVVPGGVDVSGDPGALGWLDDISKPLRRDTRSWARKLRMSRARLVAGSLSMGDLPEGHPPAPAFRASGSTADLRSGEDARGFYAGMGYRAVSRPGGTSMDRVMLLLDEIMASLDLVSRARGSAAASVLGPDEGSAGKGSSSGASESPHGAIEYRVLLGAEGRLMRVRSSSAADDVAGLAGKALRGHAFEDAVPALISLNLCAPCA